MRKNIYNCLKLINFVLENQQRVFRLWTTLSAEPKKSTFLKLEKILIFNPIISKT